MINGEYMIVKFELTPSKNDLVITTKARIIHENILSIEDAELLTQYELSKDDNSIIGIFPKKSNIENDNERYAMAKELALKSNQKNP